MNIQLAIVRACLGDGCRVRLLESGAVIDVRRDSRAVNRDRLRYGYLAALHLEFDPVIVWHWQRAQALIWRPNAVLAVLPEGRLAECQPALRFARRHRRRTRGVGVAGRRRLGSA